MKIPLYLITTSDGIPIPNTDYLLDIPTDKADYFFTHSNLADELQVIIGIVDKNPFDYLDEPNRILSPGSKLQPIGLLCTISGEAEADRFKIINLHINERVYLSGNISISDIPEVELVIVLEEFKDNEQNTYASITELVDSILDNPLAFEPEIISQLSSSKSTTVQLDILANYLLKDEESRLAYIQTEYHAERLDLITLELTNFLKKRKPKRKEFIERTKKTVNDDSLFTLNGILNRFENLDLPENTRSYLSREIEKLKAISKNSIEYTQIADYLNWVLALPWGTETATKFDLKTLINTFNETHYGLEDVKEHILEHITIERLKGGATGSVLCFIGSPGTGKTSLAKAIAKVSGRPIISIALGGLSDEAELRGHRRTYVASRPGRIITGLHQAKSSTPLILLDEVDKIVTYKGDPTSALLEILDPEQNNKFVDRYLEVSFDLSKAVFICTANYEDQIPAALKDRMDLIYFRNYTFKERVTILRKYILSSVLKDYSIEDLSIDITDEAINYLCKEEQIRTIKNHLKKLLRKAAVAITIYEHKSVIIDEDYCIEALKSKKKQTRKTVGFDRCL